jgi:hypothetical protein
VRCAGNRRAFLIVNRHPQHITEQALLKCADYSVDWPDGAPPD